jgi:hypothetical protein
VANSFQDRDDPLVVSLDELLREATDEAERTRLKKAWQALDGMAWARHAAPPPSKELEEIFGGVDEALSDEELEMLAAAGIGGAAPGMAYDGAGMVEAPAFLHKDSGRDDLLLENNGADAFAGAGTSDAMPGSSEYDTLYGDEGDDVLLGGVTDAPPGGGDVLAGGKEGDVFVFSGKGGNDTVTDFNPEEDKLQFVGANLENLSVDVIDGNTVIRLGDSIITLKSCQMSREQVLACVEDDGTA